jgi:hypothetical protein
LAKDANAEQLNAAHEQDQNHDCRVAHGERKTKQLHDPISEAEQETAARDGEADLRTQSQRVT